MGKKRRTSSPGSTLGTGTKYWEEKTVKKMMNERKMKMKEKKEKEKGK